ncbi:efflux RND transporter permease subunit [Azospirillum halopraeferens]|uniref:efflux RND transporter permease subunit n=1 Tax=Azospirillum halopraeferens TaxID=34010 RepID=UPI000424EB16|nr:efflux RND transporter permease subunit [Azospirillum halopraeferens]
MNIARASIRRPVNVWLIVLACLLGGVWGLLTIGRLEDPAFTIKQAQVITPYAGASAMEVEEEVTERLESAIQQMPQLERVTSVSKPGVSEITVEIRREFRSAVMPQIWDELRRYVGDAAGSLPPGAGPPAVHDDYGDVYGLFYALTAPGYAPGEVRAIARSLRRELLTVPGVAKVATAGEPQENIHVEVAHDRLVQMGLPIDRLMQLLDVENAVQPTGAARSGDRRVRIPVGSAFPTVGAVEDLIFGVPGSTEMIRLGDIATVTLAPVERPDHRVRHNGHEAVTLGVAAVATANVVEVGEAVAARLAALQPFLPVGVELHPIYDQAAVVDAAVSGFVLNLAASVAIVIGALCLFMGWRAGVVVGSVLLLTVLGTVFVMRVFGIELERISLGALIIGMGMLVDNAIVVAEGMLIGMQRRRTRLQAAMDVVRQTQWPLLGATVIGIMAFSGIGLSQDTTGEFLFSLFAVIGIALLLSWVLAITVTPLFGKYLFRVTPAAPGADPYDGRLYTAYRGVLAAALRARWLTIGALAAITVASVYGFGFVNQGFFPNSNTPLFYVHYWLPQGTDIRAVDRDLRAVEEIVLAQPETEAVSAFVGRGATRFMLTYAPEPANPSYGHLIVRAADLEAIEALAPRVVAAVQERFPEAQVSSERLVFGPGAGARIAARFSGPDPRELRRLAAETERVLRDDGRILDIRNDWRQREMVVVPVLSEDRARLAGVTRADLAQTVQFATDGIRVGGFRAGEETLPIIARAAGEGRGDVEALRDRLVWSRSENAYVPVMQVLDRLDTAAEEVLVRRRDRVRTLTVQANPAPGQTTAEAFARIRPAVEAIALPPGYRLEWGGEHESTRDAQGALMTRVPIGFLVMVVISVLLFGRVRQPLILWLTVPMAICGVTVALLLTGLPFGFMSLLGVLSLSGMLIKNAIVLMDEIDRQVASGKPPPDAVLDAGVSRLRPVTLAAGTTILGMLPLLGDAFFVDMAVTISGGLAFATVLTLVAVPVLYALFFGIRPPPQRQPTAPAADDGGASRPPPLPI